MLFVSVPGSTEAPRCKEVSFCSAPCLHCLPPLGGTKSRRGDYKEGEAAETRGVCGIFMADFEAKSREPD